MEKETIGLVLEGGGLRGAYTAGVLYWLLENDMHFDYVVGISSGALYASMYVLNKKETLKKGSINVAADSRNMGTKAFLREGTFVGYNFLLDELMTTLDYPLESIDQVDAVIEAGVYDIYGEETIWFTKEEIAKNPKLIQAACTLPIAGKAVKIDGKKYMDGGITTMIPLQRSIDFGNSKHLVVTTKSADYVREDQKQPLKGMLRLIYNKRPQLIRDFENRKNVYYEERKLIDEYVEKGDALYIYPSKELGVGRFSGDIDKYEALFALAQEDCEAQKDKIKSFYQSVKG